MANIDWLRIVAAGTDEILDDLSPHLQVLMHPGFSPSADCGDKAPHEFISPGCVLLASSAGERHIHHQSVSVLISVRDVLFGLLETRRQLPVRGWLCYGSSCVSLCSKYGIADTNSITDYKTRCKGLALPRLNTMNYPEHTNAHWPNLLHPADFYYVMCNQVHPIESFSLYTCQEYEYPVSSQKKYQLKIVYDAFFASSWVEDWQKTDCRQLKYPDCQTTLFKG